MSKRTATNVPKSLSIELHVINLALLDVGTVNGEGWWVMGDRDRGMQGRRDIGVTVSGLKKGTSIVWNSLGEFPEKI